MTIEQLAAARIRYLDRGMLDRGMIEKSNSRSPDSSVTHSFVNHLNQKESRQHARKVTAYSTRLFPPS